MNKTALHLILAAAIATVSIAPAAAHAQQTGGGSPGGSTGKRCQTGPDASVEDGYVGTHRTKGVRSTVTCTNGTLCTSTGVLQGDNKTRVWHYECKDANGTTYRIVRRCTQRTGWRCTAARVVKPETVKPAQAPTTAGTGQASTPPGSPAAGAIDVAPTTGGATTQLPPRPDLGGIRTSGLAIAAG